MSQTQPSMNTCTTFSSTKKQILKNSASKNRKETSQQLYFSFRRQNKNRIILTRFGGSESGGRLGCSCSVTKRVDKQKVQP